MKRSDVSLKRGDRVTVTIGGGRTFVGIKDDELAGVREIARQALAEDEALRFPENER